jgi:neutral amino acid transport system permease protein
MVWHLTTSEGDRFPARRRAVFAFLAATLGLMVMFTATSSAQQPPGTTGTTGAAQGTAIVGTLSTPSGPVAGARVEVSANGTVVAEATSAADGTFRVEVPTSGRYQVRLDTGTLPPGVQVAPQGRDVLPNVLVFEGREQRVTFALVEGAAGAAPAPDEPVGPSMIDRFAVLLVSGTRYGLVIALCAVGLTLIYATTGLVNFAHGELVTFGALMAWLLSSSSWLSLPLALATILALGLAAGFGALQDIALWEPLRRFRPGNISALVVSIGLALFLRNLYLVIFDSSPRAFAQYATQEAIEFGPFRMQPKDLVSIAVCLTALLGTAALLRWTRLGTAVRAVSDEPDLARSSGIDVRRVFLTVWALGAGLAGLGGVMLALTQSVQWDMGLRLLLVVFAAVVVGGFGSPVGATLGGLLIGLVSELSTYWVNPDLKEVFALSALILVLLVRPQGILGLRERVG